MNQKTPLKGVIIGIMIIVLIFLSVSSVFFNVPSGFASGSNPGISDSQNKDISGKADLCIAAVNGTDDSVMDGFGNSVNSFDEINNTDKIYKISVDASDGGSYFDVSKEPGNFLLYVIHASFNPPDKTGVDLNKNNGSTVNEISAGEDEVKPKKIQDDPGFDVVITDSGKEGSSLVVEFYHNSESAQPIAVVGLGESEHNLSKNESIKNEKVTLTIPGWNNRYFKLKVGHSSEVFDFMAKFYIFFLL